MEEEFSATDFIMKAKADAQSAKRKREEEEAERRAEEKHRVLDLIKDCAQLGVSSAEVRLELWSSAEVEGLFEGLVTVEKIRGKKHKISW